MELQLGLGCPCREDCGEPSKWATDGSVGGDSGYEGDDEMDEEEEWERGRGRGRDMNWAVEMVSSNDISPEGCKMAACFEHVV